MRNRTLSFLVAAFCAVSTVFAVQGFRAVDPDRVIQAMKVPFVPGSHLVSVPQDWHPFLTSEDSGYLVIWYVTDTRVIGTVEREQTIYLLELGDSVPDGYVYIGSETGYHVFWGPPIKVEW